MGRKELSFSVEAVTGAILVVMGLGAHALGDHSIFALALAPFGIGLILSDLAGRYVRRQD